MLDIFGGGTTEFDILELEDDVLGVVELKCRVYLYDGSCFDIDKAALVSDRCRARLLCSSRMIG